MIREQGGVKTMAMKKRILLTAALAGVLFGGGVQTVESGGGVGGKWKGVERAPGLIRVVRLPPGTGKAVKWVADAIAKGVAWASIEKALPERFPRKQWTAEDVRAIMEAGLREYEQAKNNPNPSAMDCAWDLYQFVNEKCSWAR